MDRNGPDYYTLLGLERSASGEEIARAYRRAARATHPDIHPDEPSAEKRFAAIAIAYETLSDPARRASYDRARPAAPRAGRVEPVRPRTATRSVAPTPLDRPPWAAPFEDDALELAASLLRFLYGSRHSF